MRKRLLGSLGALLTGAGLALAQSPPSAAPAAPAADGADPAFALPADTLLPPGPPADKPTSNLAPWLQHKEIKREPKPDRLPDGKDDGKDAFSVADDGNAFSAPPTNCPAPEHKPLFGPRPEFPKVPHEPEGRFWASAEYILWWTKNDQPGPLLSAGTADSLGVPGTPGTIVLFSDIDYGGASGVRVWAGFSNADGDLGVEGNFFQLEQRSTGFRVASDATGSTVLARPAIDAVNGRPTAELIAFPGAFSGTAAARSESHFWGSNAYFVCPVKCTECTSVELLAGFEYLDLREDLTYAQTSQILPGGEAGFAGRVLLSPTTVGIGEHFGTRNQFYGGSVGTQFEVRFGNYFLNTQGKLGLGDMHSAATVEGVTTATTPTSAATPGGLVATAVNIGEHTGDRFALAPELNVNLGFYLSPCVRLYMGYTFLYVSDTLRPGEQVATAVTPGLVPTSLQFSSILGPRPVATFPHTDYWAQGVNFGVAIRY